jgi:hypothetical protein
METDNDVLSFLLKEYEKIVEAFFDAREVTSRWVKYYLLVAAAPFSFIAFIYKEDPSKFNISNLPDTLAYLFLLVGVIGLCLACIIINSGTDSILYARTVNGIRKFYMDQACKKNCDLRPYIVLPCDVSVPKYLSLGGELSLIILISGLINSVYLGIGISQISSMKSFYLIFLLSIIIHVTYYIISAHNREKKYGPKL